MNNAELTAMVAAQLLSNDVSLDDKKIQYAVNKAHKIIDVSRKTYDPVKLQRIKDIGSFHDSTRLDVTATSE